MILPSSCVFTHTTNLLGFKFVNVGESFLVDLILKKKMRHNCVLTKMHYVPSEYGGAEFLMYSILFQPYMVLISFSYNAAAW